MKTIAYLVVALFALVTASCAAPANFINPTVEITPETCVVFQTCSATSSDAKDEFNKALLEGTWYKVGESDVANLMAQGLAFRYEGLISNDGKVLCKKATGSSEAPNVPKIIVFEFWDPTCPQKPKVCTKYNDNIIKVSSTGTDYIFVDGGGNSYFKGAGFYTSCEGPQTQTLKMTSVGGGSTSYTSTVEKVLVAGNSKEALNKTVTAIAKIVKGSFSLSRNEAGIRYQLDDGWATTAIVYFSEDKIAADLLKDKLTVGGKTPLMVDDTVNEGIIARYLLSPGKNKGRWYNIPWINEATASTVKVVASADVAFRTMATSGSTPSVPLMMFGELNSKNPGEKIVNSTIYGCKPAGEPLGTVEIETDAGVEETTMTSTGLTFTATGPYAIKDGALLVQHTDDADLYVGENGAICTFSGKEAGKCKAVIQENSKQQTQFKTGAEGAITSKKYCSEVGTDLKGNYLEYGVYSENKAAGGGTVYFMSGLAPCTTYGIANESDEYFTIFLAPDEAQYMPSCSKIAKGGSARCPYHDHSYYNGKGLGWDQWCLCASVGTQPTWPTVPAFTPAAGGGAPEETSAINVVFKSGGAQIAKVAFAGGSTKTISISAETFSVEMSPKDIEATFNYVNSTGQNVPKDTDGTYKTAVPTGTLTVTSLGEDMTITVKKVDKKADAKASKGLTPQGSGTGTSPLSSDHTLQQDTKLTSPLTPASDMTLEGDTILAGDTTTTGTMTTHGDTSLAMGSQVNGGTLKGDTVLPTGTQVTGDALKTALTGQGATITDGKLANDFTTTAPITLTQGDSLTAGSDGIALADGSTLQNSKLTKGTQLGDQTIVPAGTVIPKDTVVPQDTVVPAGTQARLIRLTLEVWDRNAAAIDGAKVFYSQQQKDPLGLSADGGKFSTTLFSPPSRFLIVVSNSGYRAYVKEVNNPGGDINMGRIYLQKA